MHVYHRPVSSGKTPHGLCINNWLVQETAVMTRRTYDGKDNLTEEISISKSEVFEYLRTALTAGSHSNT